MSPPHRSEAEELALCDALETVADALPQVCALRYVKLVGDLRKWRRQDQAQALLAAHAALTPAKRTALQPVLDRLIDDERTDADIALELMDAMMTAVQERDANVEALGYLMRGFFQNRRRHLGWRRRAFLEQLENVAPLELIVNQPLENSPDQSPAARRPRRRDD